MENQFKHLKIENKDRLPEPWYDYNVLQNGQYQTALIYSKNRDYIKIHTGIQDGVWTSGHSYHVADSYSGMNPGRKWGEFESKDDAILYELGFILEALEKAQKRTPAAIKAVQQEIKRIRFDKRQLTLF